MQMNVFFSGILCQGSGNLMERDGTTVYIYIEYTSWCFLLLEKWCFRFLQGWCGEQFSWQRTVGLGTIFCEIE